MENRWLRVKDIDRERNTLTLRQRKGDKDRVVMLPRVVREALSMLRLCEERVK
jgi:integrase